ncbi:hypothetical protein ASPACDRAFT_126400 [Aspergillus aculeatus ATCC 16872]|uniref:Mid2 domain-containing protein n=1 Tax=Aspergillus aculeatus (strain ATCC 16872 / CBS 172.66 / WB 5094) TaxID=690307 RepID=A0A1L9WHE7_ASPA1|nr:uncharacterized protein ASPACDRAFT_126400 [Aspergillus aculeatus ATCC 16872]OJJ95599.1 hypothetical protein ASPACDRAFT_126400 [Aspergillus aculeatus ATCC 16872]
MVKCVFYLCLYTFLINHARAEAGIFYNPPTGGPIHDYSEDPVYTLEQTVQLRWATSLQYLSLMLWQNDNSDYEWLQTNLSGVTSYDWVVSTQRNLSDGVVFFFQIRDATDLEDWDGVFASHYFNISAGTTTTTAVGTSTTTAVSTSATSVPSVALTASAAVTAASASAETTTPAAMTSGSGTGAKIGVGVGVGLGCALLLAIGLAWYLLWRRRKVASREAMIPMDTRSEFGPSHELPAFSKNPKYSRASVPAEMEGPGEVRYELPS